uniref:Receptor-type tyrosine-protein phosphatase kappa n=1 Tax=Rhabditophanes sp. KR3021 TaxID=114890 RepID=A0AC35U5K7_9BILA
MISVQEEKAMHLAPTEPIEESKFVAYVTERRKKNILFKGEYLMVKRSLKADKCKTEVASTMPSDRNPYPDVLPYDYNRVVLKTLPHDENSHYCNASYIDSWIHEKAYVVTQAVKTKPAIVEFWRLVWELGSNCIVMLTKVFDFMRVMCLQYWPIGTAKYGHIQVETLETKTYAHFVIRTFKLRTFNEIKGEETRIVKHFHFTEWELDSFPYISAFIELRRRVRQFVDNNDTDAPMLVHCSNGGGRSGAFLSLDANLELLKKTGQLDPFEYAKTLVNSRHHLIDTKEQYEFIYEVICETVLCNLEPIPLRELKDRTNSYKNKKSRQQMETQDTHENKLLAMLTPTLRIGDCAGGHRLENRGKNRDVMVVPPDHARPYLQTLHGESKDYTYINAVEVDGYTRKSEYIVTEWPKSQTVDSFWTLIFDHSCHTVINLTNQPGTKSYPSFIHNKGKQNYGPFVVELINFQQYPGMTSHMVKIMKKRGYSDVAKLLNVSRANANGDGSKQIQKLTFMISEIMASGASQAQMEAEVKVCCIISVTMWPIENKIPMSTSKLIDAMRMARSWKKRAPDRPETKPTIVLSHNGYSRCGIFIAANVCIDQMEMDREIDVFHAVKMIRINRPQLIDIKDEYKYLYDLMLHYYNSTPEYQLSGEESDREKSGELSASSPSTSQAETSQVKSRSSYARTSMKETNKK